MIARLEYTEFELPESDRFAQQHGGDSTTECKRIGRIAHWRVRPAPKGNRESSDGFACVVVFQWVGSGLAIPPIPDWVETSSGYPSTRPPASNDYWVRHSCRRPTALTRKVHLLYIRQLGSTIGLETTVMTAQILTGLSPPLPPPPSNSNQSWCMHLFYF